MPEAPIETVPAALPAGPDDTVVFALTHLRPPRRGRRLVESLYAVVHRRYGVWTHLYAIVAESPRNRTEVRLLKVLAGFIISMGLLFGAIPLVAVIGVTLLEIMVALIQAYVFTILTCIYLNDAFHPSH